MDLVELFLSRGRITKAQAVAIRQGASAAADQFEAIIDAGLIEENDALNFLARETRVPRLDLEATPIDPRVLSFFPLSHVHHDLVFPICFENGELIVATCNPLDPYTLDEIGFEARFRISPRLTSRRQIHRLMTRYLGIGSDTLEGLAEHAVERADGGADSYLEGTELSAGEVATSVSRLVNQILFEAIECGASDIHLEIQKEGLVVRYRIDGILHRQPVSREINEFARTIISRIKIMSRLNIAEKRLPQDGRMKVRCSDREIDVRVSVIPMLRGEGVVLRLLDRENMLIGLPLLGMDDHTLVTIRRLIRLPHGLILVTGPTGSGKTTTLYSVLHEIKSDETKIITIEDPIEYELEGVNQVQVNTNIGLSFARSLRSILRHDPDIVLVGEIRDLETVQNSIQASLTGHLVFSTLHTNDAATAITRLLDLGVEPFLIVSTVEAILAQRLVRKLCEQCKQAYEPQRDELPEDFPSERLGPATVFRPVGCPACRLTGYRGRVGLFELLVANTEVRRLIGRQADSWDIKQAAIAGAEMATLRQDGWNKVLRGMTSIGEVIRVTRGDLQEPLDESRGDHPGEPG